MDSRVFVCNNIIDLGDAIVFSLFIADSSLALIIFRVSCFKRFTESLYELLPLNMKGIMQRREGKRRICCTSFGLLSAGLWLASTKSFICRLDHPDPGKYLCFTVDEHRVTNHKAKRAYSLNLKLGQYTEAYAPAHDALLLNHFSLFRHATKQLDLHAPHEGRSHPPINFFGALFKFRPRLPSQMANDMYFVIVDHHLEKHKPKGTTSRRPNLFPTA